MANHPSIHVTFHKNVHFKTILMKGHNIVLIIRGPIFYGEVWKIRHL